MAKKTALGSIKRYGVRYGAKNKEKVAALEKLHRGYHKCPYCRFEKVKRLAAGIWQCDKCSTKFAGKAYTYSSGKKKKEIIQKIDLSAYDEKEKPKEEYEKYKDTPEKIEENDIQQDILIKEPKPVSENKKVQQVAAGEQ